MRSASISLPPLYGTKLVHGSLRQGETQGDFWKIGFTDVRKSPSRRPARSGWSDETGTNSLSQGESQGDFSRSVFCLEKINIYNGLILRSGRIQGEPADGSQCVCECRSAVRML